MPSHPFRGGDSFSEKVLRMNGFDALETHNGLNSEIMNPKVIHVTKLRNLSSVGGSDCHYKNQVGKAFTEFKNSVHTMNDLTEEIKKGNWKAVAL